MQGPFAEIALLLLICAMVGALFVRRCRPVLIADAVLAIGAEFDPEPMRAPQRQGLPVHFGDAEVPEFVQPLPLARARWVITAFPQLERNRAPLPALPAVHYDGPTAAAVRDPAHGRARAAAGVPWNLNPFDDAADPAAWRPAAAIRAPQRAHEVPT